MVKVFGSATLGSYALAVAFVLSGIAEFIVAPQVPALTTMTLGLVIMQCALAFMICTRHVMWPLLLALVGLSFDFAGIRMMAWDDVFSPWYSSVLASCIFFVIVYVGMRRSRRFQAHATVA